MLRHDRWLRSSRAIRRSAGSHGGIQTLGRPAVKNDLHAASNAELHEAAEQLTVNQAALIAVGEPTIEKGLHKPLTKAAKVVMRTVEATTDQITSELQEALKG